MDSVSKSDSFQQYLASKKVSAQQFQKELPFLWEKLEREYDLSGKNAFDARQKFQLNNLRLQFPLTEPEE